MDLHTKHINLTFPFNVDKALGSEKLNSYYRIEILNIRLFIFK